ncbi:MAG TPA: helix-turn-helix domain-containing protein [Lapillicoccus sp.]|nr:helix-turn-helix domain-containing protein [Lapillicoccus sp.]
MSLPNPTRDRRAYRSLLREEQARQTRRAVVDAATELFVEVGYAGTTIDAIAARAGVSRRTVFASVDGGKAQLLRQAWDRAIVGDDEPVPMVQRPEVQRLTSQDDVLAGLRGWARQVSDVNERVAGLALVLVAAADADPEVAQLLSVVETQRLTGGRMLVSWLSERGGLRRGVAAERAAQICWIQSDPVDYRRLVVERGWTTAQYQRYLVDVIRATVLPD